MLVLAREILEVIQISDDSTVHIKAPSAEEREALIQCPDPRLSALVKRLIEAQPGAIEITLCDLRGDKARIGVDAPKDVRIDRREVLAAIKRGITPLEAKEQGESVRVGAERVDPYVPGSGIRRG